MSKKILLTCGQNSSTNLGTAAQIVTFSLCLKQLNPNVSLCLFSYFPRIDKKFYSKYGIEVPQHSVDGHHVLFSMLKQQDSIIQKKKDSVSSRLLSIFNDVDLIVDFNGDALSGSIETTFIPKGLLINTLPMLIGMLVGKPVVLFSQSIGPFYKANLVFAKSFLNKNKLIVVRDNYSYDYLKKIGLKSSIIRVPEIAYLLAPTPAPNIFQNNNTRPLIGFSISAFQGTHFNNYQSTIAGLLKWIVNELHGQIIFIPHVSDSYCDDKVEARKICSLVPELKKSIFLVEDSLSPEIAKGLIGECDLFIASRWHASIASLSTGIPTILIGHSHKYWALMNQLGLDEYVIDVRSISIAELISKTNKAWIEKDFIQKRLKSQISMEKKNAMDAIRLVAKVIEEE